MKKKLMEELLESTYRVLNKKLIIMIVQEIIMVEMRKIMEKIEDNKELEDKETDIKHDFIYLINM